MKYIFLGSPDFAVVILDHLIKNFGAPCLVVTQPPREAGRGQKLTPTDVAKYSKNHSLACLEVQNINEPSTFDQLAHEKPEIILVAAFGQILKEPLLRLAPYCLNVHASLLPKYRGAAPIQRAILNGDAETGVTIQRMSKKLDTGDILLHKKIMIGDQETSATLFNKLARVGAEASLEALQLIARGSPEFIPQEEALATYAAKITKEEARIVWTESAKAIERKVRAFQPWPIAFCLLGETPMKVWSAEISESKIPLPPGSIRTDLKTFLEVGTGSSESLSLLEVQAANRSRVSIADFLRGFQGNFPFQTMG